MPSWVTISSRWPNKPRPPSDRRAYMRASVSEDACERRASSSQRQPIKGASIHRQHDPDQHDPPARPTSTIHQHDPDKPVHTMGGLTNANRALDSGYKALRLLLSRGGELDCGMYPRLLLVVLGRHLVWNMGLVLVLGCIPHQRPQRCKLLHPVRIQCFGRNLGLSCTRPKPVPDRLPQHLPQTPVLPRRIHRPVLCSPQQRPIQPRHRTSSHLSSSQDTCDVVRLVTSSCVVCVVCPDGPVL